MEFKKDIIDLLKIISKILDKNKIPFALIGGLAVSILSRPRATEDIDLLILLDETQRDLILSFIKNKIKVISYHRDIMRFSNASIWRIVTEGKQGTSIIIDFIFADNEIYKNALNRRIELNFSSMKLPIVTPEDLILIKTLSNRDIDKLDIKSLLDEQTHLIDKTYIKKWIKKIDVIEKNRK